MFFGACLLLPVVFVVLHAVSCHFVKFCSSCCFFFFFPFGVCFCSFCAFPFASHTVEFVAFQPRTHALLTGSSLRETMSCARRRRNRQHCARKQAERCPAAPRKGIFPASFGSGMFRRGWQSAPCCEPRCAAQRTRGGWALRSGLWSVPCTHGFGRAHV